LRGERHAMLDVQKCREILGVSEEVSDEEIKECERRLRAIATVILEAEMENQ